MSNEMQVFNNEQFGQIRTTTINGEPWFVLKDVCAVFGESNYRRIVDRIDDDEKGVSQIETPGGKQSMIIVNEYGVYSTLFAMQPTKARGVSDEYTAERQRKVKQFKHWVTHDVLPSIRKHGMYATPQTIDNIINDPDFGIRLLTELKNERNKRMELEAQREVDKPKVDFADALLVCDNCSYIEELAKQLCQIGMKTGRNRLIAEMADDGFLCVRNGVKNMPTQKCVEAGWLVIERKPHIEGERSVMGFTTKVTPSGMQHFMAFYMRKHGLMPLLTIARQSKRSVAVNHKLQRQQR